MSQIKTGTVIVTQGSLAVTGVGVDWSGVTIGTSIFVIQGHAQTYLVAQTHNESGVWTLTLNRAYLEATTTDPDGDAYTIQKDFTTFLNLPIIAPGDIEVATILTQAFQKLDSAYGQMGGGGEGGGNTYTFDVTVNDYVIGTVVALDKSSGQYAKADSNSVLTNSVIGIVSAIEDLHVTIQTSGLILNISALPGSLTPGAIYYLAGTPASPSLNWTSDPSKYTNAIPVFQATGPSTVFVIPTSALSTNSAFTGTDGTTDGSGGSVPPPLKTQVGYVLGSDGQWVQNTPTNDSIIYPMLKARSAPALTEYNDVLWTSGLPTARVSDMLFDLLMRAKRRDLRQAGAVPVTLAPGTGTFQVPAGVTMLLVEMWGAGGAGYKNELVNSTWITDPESTFAYNGMSPDLKQGLFTGGSNAKAPFSLAGCSGAYARFLLPVMENQILTLKVGSGENTTKGATAANVNGLYFTTTIESVSTWIKNAAGTTLAYVEGGAGADTAYSCYALLNNGSQYYANGAGSNSLIGWNRTARVIFDASLTLPGNYAIALPGNRYGGVPLLEGGTAPFGGRGGKPLLSLDLVSGQPWYLGVTPGGGASAAIAVPDAGGVGGLTNNAPSGGNAANLMIPKGGDGMIRITY